MKKVCLLLIVFTLLSTTINAQEVNSKSTIKFEGNKITLKESKIEIDQNGFPKQIQTFYKETTAPTDLLYENIHFHFVRKSDGKNINLKNSGVKFLSTDKLKSAKKVKWSATSENDSLKMEITAILSFDGSLLYNVNVIALQDLSLKDVTMHIPLIKTVPTRMLGFGVPEGDRPEKVEWKWDGDFKNENGAWLGNQDAGMKYVLEKGDWGNKGKGGVSIGIKGSSMLANNYTGSHEMKKGDIRHYDFKLLIKPLNSTQKR